MSAADDIVVNDDGVPLHNLIMEATLGRPLLPSEAVEHIDGNSPLDFDEARSREAQEMIEDLDLIEALLVSGNSFHAAAYAYQLKLTDTVPVILHRLWAAGTILDQELPDALHWVWVNNRSPLRGLGERAWLRIFKAAGFVSAISDIHVNGQSVPPRFSQIYDRPTAPATVWRGAAISTHGRGMSWSIHRECAENFARNNAALYGIEQGIYRATVPARAVLALFGNEEEQEVVVNPNMLRGRVVLEETIAVPDDATDRQRIHDLTHVAEPA